MQSDCYSAILFIIFLERHLIKSIKTKMTGFLATLKYADDIPYAGTSKQQINDLGNKVLFY